MTNRWIDSLPLALMAKCPQEERLSLALMLLAQANHYRVNSSSTAVKNASALIILERRRLSIEPGRLRDEPQPSIPCAIASVADAIDGELEDYAKGMHLRIAEANLRAIWRTQG